jgi:hypothetical protein
VRSSHLDQTFVAASLHDPEVEIEILRLLIITGPFLNALLLLMLISKSAKTFEFSIRHPVAASPHAMPSSASLI